MTIDVPPPQLLFKFRNWNDTKHQTLLKKRELWVPDVKTLNDPFDCQIPLRWDLMKHDDLVDRMASLIKEDSQDEDTEEVRRFAEKRITELGIYDLNSDFLNRFVELNRKDLGVVSFATDRSNPLLWSHYADSHRGYCVGFDRTLLLKQLYLLSKGTKAAFLEFWVEYVSKYPEIVPSRNAYDDDDSYFKIVRAKSNCWEYEKEYRIAVFGKSDFAIHLHPSVVAEVILGSEMLIADRAAIRQLVNVKFPEAKLFQARPGRFSFDLEFD